MALDAANARIFGSDDDKASVGPLGTTLPTTLAALDPALEDIGWLNSDGFTVTPSDSVEKIRGHQGARVVRTTITESDLAVAMVALETKPLTFGLQHNITGSATLTGVTTMTASPGRNIEARAMVLDLYDRDDTSIHYRYIFPRVEFGERSEVTMSNADITAYSFTAEVIGEFTIITNDPAFVVA